MQELRLSKDCCASMAMADSPDICYFLMPRGLKEDVLEFISEAAPGYRCNMAVIHGMDWNDAMTPWAAEGVFKEKKPFGGHADEFLSELTLEHLPAIEREMKLSEPVGRRYLVGTSLSGLFAIWATTRTAAFQGMASISGSLWYDGFADWFCNQGKYHAERVHMSLGNREKNAKEPRMGGIETCTERVVTALRQQGIKVDYELIEGTHFSPIIPRLELAMESLINH